MKQEAKKLIETAIESIAYDLKIDKKEFLESAKEEIATYRTSLIYYSTKFKGTQIKRGLRSQGLFTLKEIGRIFCKAQCTISFAATSFENQVNKGNKTFINAGLLSHKLLFGSSDLTEKNKKLNSINKSIEHLELEKEKVMVEIKQILRLKK